MEPSTGQPRRRGRKRRIAGWGLAGLVVLALLVVGAFIFLTRTTRGNRVVLEYVLDQVRGSLAGELTVGEIRSRGLLNGAVLEDVTLTAAENRRFLEADSVVLRYAWRNLLGGPLRITSVVVYGAEVEISRYHGEETMNIENLLAPSQPDAPPGTFAMDLERAVLVDALVEVLTPAENPDEVAPTIPSPVGEGRLRRLALEDLQLELSDVLIRAAEEELVTAVLENTASRIHIFEDPLVLSGADGRLRAGADGIFIDDGTFRLPESTFEGAIALAPEDGPGTDWAFQADAETRGPGRLEDLRWADARIPDGTFDGGIELVVGDQLEADLHALQLELPGSSLRLDGLVVFDQEASFRDLRVRASPLDLDRLEPWMEADLPVDGFVRGTLNLSGTASRLRTDGRLTLVARGVEGGPTTGDFDGTVHLGDDPGVSDFDITLDPLNPNLLDLVQPDLAPPGTARAVVHATGRLSRGVEFEADVTHTDDAGVVSRVVADGTLRRQGRDRWIPDIQGEVLPLSARFVQRYLPNTRLAGEARGTFGIQGPLEALDFQADLAVGGGRLVAEGRVNATDIAAGYRVDARLDGVTLSDVAPDLPELSAWTGRLVLSGRGTELGSLVAEAEIYSGRSRLGGLLVDSIRSSLRASGGLLTVDTLDAVVGGITVAGSGTLGLVGAREGTAHIRFETDSLQDLRPLLQGELVTVRDSLYAIDLELLRAQGVDPDTLPTQAEVELSGRIAGEVDLRGSLEALDAEGRATLVDARWGLNRVDTAHVEFQGQSLGSPAGSLQVDLDARRVHAAGQDFERVVAEIETDGELRAGTAALDVVRDPDEHLVAHGDFALDSTRTAGRFRLADARLEFEGETYTTAQPAELVWDGSSLEIDGLVAVSEGADSLRIEADGTVDRAGNSDLSISIASLDLERGARLLRIEELGLAGVVDLTVDVSGPAEDPTITGRIAAIDPGYREIALDSLGGTFTYQDLTAEVDFEAWGDGRRFFRATGDVPVNLALTAGVDRIVQTPMDIRVLADSMSAAVPLAYLGDVLTDVEGTVSGDFRIQGTIDEPVPTGVLTMEDAAWTMGAVGVRHEDIRGTLTLQPDATVLVDVTGRAQGDVEITGVVTVEPLLNPSLDLTIALSRFEAIDRRDLEGSVSGTLTLTGTYERPFVSGDVEVNEGTIYLQEFTRAAGIVDLTDARFNDFDAIDTTYLSGRAVLAGVRNPFLDHLRASIDLSVPGNTWLRSPDMNVEIGGDLIVTYDREQRDIVMVGELEALRGTYNVAGRRFDVESGTVAFVGTPGVNPRLDITAVSRIRRSGDPALEVEARVVGNLTQPRVTLGTQEQGLTEADLVSYLVFGQPSYALGSNQAELVGNALSQFVVGNLATHVGGYLATRLGLDYINVTQVNTIGSGDIGGFLTSSQIEIGRYFGEDFFAVIVLQPADADDFFAGVRVEWIPTDLYTVEAYIEDRFFRAGSAAFEDLDVNESQVLGLFIFREWGY